MNSVSKAAANRHTRRWIPYLGAVLLVLLIVAGLWPRPLPVEIARATAGTLRATVNEEGKTRIKQRYVVSAPVTGQLRRIPFKAGAEVKAGETILAVIDPLSPALLDARARTTAQAKRDTAAANLEKARANSNFASSELKRFEQLYAGKTISVQELETAQLRQAAAAKEVAAAESSLRQAEAELAEFRQTPSNPGNEAPASAGPDPSNTNPDQPKAPPPAAASNPVEVKAPADGRVLRVFEENARVVTAGTPLAEIGNPADLEVVIEVLSRDGAAIPDGAKVELEQWGGGQPLEARVRLVEPAAFTKVSALGVEEQRVNVIADLLSATNITQHLGDKFRVEAKIIVWETDQALKVPAGALFRNGDQWAAFVVVGGRAALRPVKVGRSSGTETQVLEGLKAGDEVILYPGSRVHDGQRVKTIVL